MELFFFTFLFTSFCHSVIYRVVSIVSDGRNQSSFVFFMQSSSRCMDVSTLFSMLALLLLLLLRYSFESVSYQYQLTVFHWSLSDSKSLQISRTLLIILADHNNAAFWMISTCPPTSKSANTFTNPLGIVPSKPITAGITVTFVFHSFFSSLARS